MTAKFDLSDVEFHSFHWDNFNRDVLNAHKKVMAHFGLNVIYTEENMEHGEWLDRVMSRATKNVVAIIEPDCSPRNSYTKITLSWGRLRLPIIFIPAAIFSRHPLSFLWRRIATNAWAFLRLN
ncbi:hypothetical protein P7L91_04845 [Bisgaard Taxon 10/6]|nr:hypothetical protein [Exercitatus varius]